MRIGVLGCGWLGLPLAKEFIIRGYKVHGSTTSSRKLAVLEEAGIIPFMISVTQEGITGDIKVFLSNIDVLIINIPPGIRKGSEVNFVAAMRHLLPYIEMAQVHKVVFISSTSVYGNVSGDVTENTVPQPSTESGKQLLEAEHLFQSNANFKVAVIRFAGLIGDDRNPVYHLAGRKDLSGGYEYVHLIHLEDCIGIICKIIEEGRFPFLLNAVYPKVDFKINYYKMQAENRGLIPPAYLDDQVDASHKRITSEASKCLNYSYKRSIFL